MLIRQRMQPVASLLILVAASTSASPWQCQDSADGFWDCTRTLTPAGEAEIAPAIPAAEPAREDDGVDSDTDSAQAASVTTESTSPQAQDEPAPQQPAPEYGSAPAAAAPLFPTTTPPASSPATTPERETQDEPFDTPLPEEATPEPTAATPEHEPPSAATPADVETGQTVSETPSAESVTEPARDTPLPEATVTTVTGEDDGEAREQALDQSPADTSRETTRDAPPPVATDADTTAKHAGPVPDIIESSGTTSTLSTITGIADERLDEALDYSRWVQCPPVEYRRVKTPAGPPGTVELHADNARAVDNNIFTLEGNAVAEMDWQRLEADRMTYNQAEGRIDAEGNLVYTSPELLVDGARGTLYPDTDVGDIAEARYALPDKHARGVASSVELEGRDWQHMRDVSYTTCSVQSTDWEIFAKEVDLDQKSGTGTARHARVELKGVPVLYSPYLSFPLDDRRKSGFLVPKFGVTDETGFDVSVPWYWNIAPHRDATIVPRIMTDRGLMLGGEFRYKNEKNKGSVSGEYLPSDREFNNENRYLVGFQHNGNPLPRLKTSVRASEVSDDFYFDDFGKNLVQTSQTNLERVASADYFGRGWDLGVMVQNYQTIDPTINSRNRPYEQLPRVVLGIEPASRWLSMKFDANVELNNFKHSGDVLVEGSRFDIQPTLRLPVNRPGWYIDPSVAVRYTAYNLTDNLQSDNDSPTRTTPIVSLDAGSFFERSSRWGNTDYVQTLEPRLFYLYVPEVNQDDIPIFDTANYDFNYWTLFRENRFSGPDRMGDANQLAVALTSRLLKPASGVEQLSISLGSLLYFSDREITLPGEPVETDSTSNIIGELTLGLTHNWRARAETQWNPHSSQAERNSFHLQYRKGSRQLVNLAYRYRRGIQEQTDISALWPLGNSWHLVGRWYYSLLDNETLEAMAGLGYESCCWSVQVVGRSFIKNLNETNNAIFMQVELKGLGRLANTVDKALERGILGYDSL